MTCLKASAGMLGRTKRVAHVISNSFRNHCKLYWITPHSQTLLILPAALWYKCCYYFYFMQLGIRDLISFPKVPKVIRLENTRPSTSGFLPSFTEEQEDRFKHLLGVVALRPHRPPRPGHLSNWALSTPGFSWSLHHPALLSSMAETG